jgi:membrane glycosyltransferase
MIDRYRAAARRRRALFFGLTFLSAVLAGALMFEIVRANGLTVLEAIGLVLFFGLFTWIAGAFWTALAGFIIRLIGRDPVVMHSDEASKEPLRGRTALVMPVYNEEPTRVLAGIEAIWRSLSKEKEQGSFDFFILSDTRKPEIAELEEEGWRGLIARLEKSGMDAAGRIFYRRRPKNTARKAGNIEDFVRSWGGAYDYMVVLDADSIMTGHALVTLAKLMDAYPDAGIIQSLPTPAGRDTLFARLVQFAARLNGLMLSSGLAYWQLGEGNYWGHNAIIRVRPFAQYCGLPKLPGAAPLGGEILSHDFVEAAFMRRAGFKVWMVTDLEGSWEEVPSNIIDYAARDRRWAQGNLQHFGVMPMKGLHWLSRLHMLTGILAYATSPMWLTVLIISSIVTCVEAIQGHQYFEPGAYTLFPSWPESRVTEIASLLAVTIVVLLAPKIMGATLVLIDKAQRKAFGGGPRVIVSLVLEQIFSMLLAPSMMMYHSMFVVSTLAGIPVQWNAQERGDRGITYPESFLRHKWHVVVGILWGIIIWTFAPGFIYWLLPVLVGLLFSVPLAVWTSRASLGVRLREWGLLLTPEETNTPPELQAIEHIQPIPKADGPVDADPVPARVPLAMEATSRAYVSFADAVIQMQRVALNPPEETPQQIHYTDRGAGMQRRVGGALH